MFQRLKAVFGLAVLSATPAAAQIAQPYAPVSLEEIIGEDVSYDPAIPKPEDVVGYRLGEIVFPPEMLQAYALAIAEASDRVTAETIGESHFGRPIIRFTVTSPANHARMDEIRETHLALSRTGRAETPQDQPIIVQFTHGVHGAEASGYDASAGILYHLAAAQDDATRRLLEETVLHQVILINPDGAHRFSTNVNRHRAARPVADPQHAEHDAGYGRQNHYGFDINRQWIPVTQPEARALVRSTHEWRPHLAVDFHEMGTDSTYFFSPGPLDQLHPLLSPEGFALNQRINEEVEARFNRDGTLYVSEEVFDDFYLGYGSSYPGLLGGVAYLLEQSSARGLVQESVNGLARYDMKIAGQVHAGLALVRSAHQRRAEMIAFQRDFANETRRRAEQDEFFGFVFRSDDRGRLADFIDMLQVHEVEVHRLARDARFGGIDFPSGDSFIVPLDQPVYRVIRGLFETRIVTEETRFYDVSGWTQPLAWDIDYAPAPRRQAGPNLVGESVESIERSAAFEAAPYAYVLDWTHFRSPKALYRILLAGLRAKVLPDAVTVETTRDEVRTRPGAVVIPVLQQDLEPADIHALMGEIARGDGVTLLPAVGSATREGSDLGGFLAEPLETPEILMLYNAGVSTENWGELWHLLDHEMEMAVSLAEPRDFARLDLSRYTHVILPSAGYGELGESGAERLRDFARAGGVVIGIERAANFLIDNGVASAEFAAVPEDAPAVELPTSYADLERWETEEEISGSIFSATADLAHPLNFGVTGALLPIHVQGTEAFLPGDNPFAIPVRYDAEGLLSGYASERAQAQLAGSGFVHAERVGAGSVILFADPPYFRAYTRGTSRVLMNAIFFGKAFSDPGRRSPY